METKLKTKSFSLQVSVRKINRFFESLLSQKKLNFDCAQAARAHPFSAARERVERDRKGGNHVSPLWTPYKGRGGGSSKAAREVCRLKMSGWARSNRRHTSVAPLIQFFILPPLENPENVFYKRKLWAGVSAKGWWRQKVPSKGAEWIPYRIARVRPLLRKLGVGSRNRVLGA